MATTLKLLFAGTLAFCGLVIAWRDRRFAARLTGIYCGIFLAILTILAITGWYPRSAPTALVHRAIGHVAVIFAWIGGLISLGVCAVDFRLRPLRSCGRILLLAILFLVALCGSFTGYLGPTHSTNPETVRRFWVLHGLVFPSLCLGIAGYWFWRTSAAITEP